MFLTSVRRHSLIGPSSTSTSPSCYVPKNPPKPHCLHPVGGVVNSILGSNTIVPRRMTRRTIDFDTVRKLARELGDVEESTIHGAPSLKVRGKLLTCLAVHKSAEPGSLAVRIDFERRAELMAKAPDIYYLTDHYVNYPTVLVRLSRIQPDALKHLLGMAWSFVTMKASKRRRLTTGRPVKRE